MNMMATKPLYVEFTERYFFLIVSTIIIVTLVLIVSLIIKSRVKKLRIGDTPGKITATVMSSIDSYNKFVKSNIGKHWKYIAPLALTLGIFIFLSNISGIFLLDTPTKYTGTTVALALFAVFIIQTTGIVSRGWRHMKTLVGPVWQMSFFMIPLNILSDLMPIISLSLRLFGNVASGTVLVGLIYSGLPFYVAPIAGVILHVIFDIAFGFIQTIVFVLLTVILASNKVEESDFDILLEGEMLNA